MFSGYLFFYKFNEWKTDLYLNKIRKRIKTLFVPYVIWNSLLILSSLSIVIIKRESALAYLSNLWNTGILHLFWDSKVLNENATNILGWSLKKWAPHNIPLWFLRDLIMVCLLSPLLFAGLKYLKKYFLVLLGICFLLNAWTIIPGFSITSLFFFSLGAYFGIYNKNMIKAFSKHKYIYWIIASIALILSVILKGSTLAKVTSQLYTFTGVLSVFVLSSALIQKQVVKVNTTLSRSSFFLYCLHTILILSISQYILNKILGIENMVSVIFSYLLSPILCTIICLGVFLLLRKIAPSLLNILAGSRK
jgi:membrane-bound acyltransferase YfiQ involved in biofilm formation